MSFRSKHDAIVRESLDSEVYTPEGLALVHVRSFLVKFLIQPLGTVCIDRGKYPTVGGYIAFRSCIHLFANPPDDDISDKKLYVFASHGVDTYSTMLSRCQEM